MSVYVGKFDYCMSLKVVIKSKFLLAVKLGFTNVRDIYCVGRLTPPILLTGAATATIARFALVGPYGGYVERSLVEVCRKYWWHDILYISNLPNIMKLVRVNIALRSLIYNTVL